MKPLNDATARVLDVLTRGLQVGDSRKFDRSKGFMELTVQRLTQTTYSLSHYYEQGGDLVCDADMVFHCRHTADSHGCGVWIPVALQLSTGSYTRAVELDADEKPHRIWPAAFEDLRKFATVFVRNVREQQKINTKKIA